TSCRRKWKTPCSCPCRWSQKCIAGKTGMKQSKRYIAVTGGIGSGKSTVAWLIGTMGYPVFSADAAARDIYSDPCVLAEVRRRFPACIRGGEVDRKALADVVFSDKAALRALDSITHP